MNVHDKAYELKKALQNSPQVEALRKAKEKVVADPANKKMLEDFLARQFELQQAHLMGEKIAEEKVKAFEELSQIVSLNTSVREYLSAQYALAQVLSDIHKIIGEAVEDLLPPMDFLKK